MNILQSLIVLPILFQFLLLNNVPTFTHKKKNVDFKHRTADDFHPRDSLQSCQCLRAPTCRRPACRAVQTRLGRRQTSSGHTLELCISRNNAIVSKSSLSIVTILSMIAVRHKVLPLSRWETWSLPWRRHSPPKSPSAQKQPFEILVLWIFLPTI